MTTIILFSIAVASVALTVWLVQRGGSQSLRVAVYRLLYWSQNWSPAPRRVIRHRTNQPIPACSNPAAGTGVFAGWRPFLADLAHRVRYLCDTSSPLLGISRRVPVATWRYREGRTSRLWSAYRAAGCGILRGCPLILRCPLRGW